MKPRKQKFSAPRGSALLATSVKPILIWAILATITSLVLIGILCHHAILPLLLAVGRFLVEFRKALVELLLECAGYVVKALKAWTDHK